MREVRVYDHDFPTFEQMLVGVPPEEHPKEVWLEQMGVGEVAVRYKDFKTGTARGPRGEYPDSSEICRIFSSLEEAVADSKRVTEQHWTVRCFIYDPSGALLDTVSSNRRVGEFALASYLGMFVWLLGFAIIGMGLIWLLVRAAYFLFPSGVATTFQISRLSWFWRIVYGFSGLAIGIMAWLLHISLEAKRRVSRMTRNLDALLTPDDKKKFEELNTLHRTKDPVERERLQKLTREYQEKIVEALKK